MKESPYFMLAKHKQGRDLMGKFKIGFLILFAFWAVLATANESIFNIKLGTNNPSEQKAKALIES